MSADPNRRLRVLIVDDHPMVRKGLRATLEAAGDVEVVAEAATVVAAMMVVRCHQLDLVISDIALPDKTGLDLLKMIKAEQHQLPVLILSMHAEEFFAVRALKLGAAGYVMKDVDGLTLMQAIHKAASGGKYISSGVAERLAAQLTFNDTNAAHERLSEREFEVFRLIALGISLTDIGKRLNVSVKTVSGYRARIMGKTGFLSNADLTRYALAQCLID
jgi:DNA-binding NarL/FixJ family response regulator